MFRWHFVKDNDWPQNMTTCFCQLYNANFEFGLLEFMDGQFLDDQCVPCKVFRWCYIDDIARALNDITRAFMQSENLTNMSIDYTNNAFDLAEIS